MSIQQTVNQGLAVAAALGTQTPQYQAKIAKRKTEMEESGSLTSENIRKL